MRRQRQLGVLVVFAVPNDGDRVIFQIVLSTRPPTSPHVYDTGIEK